MVRRQIIFLLILIFLLSNKVSSQDSFTDQSLLENDDGTYKIELITSNVEYTVMDMVKYERLIEEGISIKSARNQSTHYDELYNLVFGNAILISEEVWRGITETLNLFFIPGMRETVRSGMREPIAGTATELDW